MFFDIFAALCAERGISHKRAVTEMGLSNSLATKWKKTGAIPNGETLAKVAAYFGVPVGFLLTGEKKDAPALERGTEEWMDSLSDADLEALFLSAGQKYAERRRKK